MPQEGSAYTKFYLLFQAAARNTKFYEEIWGEHREKIEEILTEFHQRKKNSAFYIPIVINQFYLYFFKSPPSIFALMQGLEWG